MAVEKTEIYDREYYNSHCGHLQYDRSVAHWSVFFGKIADEIISVFRPSRVFDAGCAHGFLVEALWDRGVITSGRDISQFAISNVRADLKQYCEVGSLTQTIKDKFDVVISIEVLEHMTEADGMIAIANMTAAADCVIFSSSPDDFAEPTHINVKPALYWMRAFAEHNFEPLIETTIYSITPYALAFVRRDKKPSDAYLSMCANIVFTRISQHRLSRELNAAKTNLAQQINLVADKNACISQKDALIDQMAHHITLAQTRAASYKAKIEGMKEVLEKASKACEQEVKTNIFTMRSTEKHCVQNILQELRRYEDSLAEEKMVISSSGLFDRKYYLTVYSDVDAAGLDPIVHFAEEGWMEGRDPSGDFDTKWYLEANKDVAALGLNPFVHYIRYGLREGRKPHGREDVPKELEP